MTEIGFLSWTRKNIEIFLIISTNGNYSLGKVLENIVVKEEASIQPLYIEDALHYSLLNVAAKC